MPAGSFALTAIGLVTAIANAACGDGAVGAAYRGERIGVIRGRAVLGERGPGAFFPDNTGWRLRASITWAAPDGATEIDDHAVLTIDPERRFELAVYTRPPEGFARAALNGTLTLGQIDFWADLNTDGHRDDGDAIVGRPSTLVAWSPEGAAGGLVIGKLAPGLYPLEPTAPCAVEPLTVEPLGERESVMVTLELPPPTSFFEAACEGEPR